MTVGTLILSHIITLTIGAVLGMTVTCCCVISGRADKQLGNDDVPWEDEDLEE